MSEHTVDCPKCGGTGRRPMPKPLERTLAKIQSSDHPLTRADLHEEGIGLTAINNRLVALERLGFIEPAGKDTGGVLWRAVKP